MFTTQRSNNGMEIQDGQTQKILTFIKSMRKKIICIVLALFVFCGCKKESTSSNFSDESTATSDGQDFKGTIKYIYVYTAQRLPIPANTLAIKLNNLKILILMEIESGN